MAEPFLAEIRIVSFNFAPKGWATCNGQFMPIIQNQALFSLLGTTFGGNGQTTFALPNMQGRVPIHFGGGFTLGEKAGEVSHTLTQFEMPTHTHFVNGTQANGTTNNPAGMLPGRGLGDLYASPVQLVNFGPTTVTNTGGSQPHNNMQPYLVLTYIIALQGIFPSQN